MAIWVSKATYYRVILNDVVARFSEPRLRVYDGVMNSVYKLEYDEKYDTVKDYLKFLPDDLNNYICKLWLKIEMDCF